MADIKNFSAEEILKIMQFYQQYTKFGLIMAIINNLPHSTLNEILESDDVTIRKFQDNK